MDYNKILKHFQYEQNLFDINLILKKSKILLEDDEQWHSSIDYYGRYSAFNSELDFRVMFSLRDEDEDHVVLQDTSNVVNIDNYLISNNVNDLFTTRNYFVDRSESNNHIYEFCDLREQIMEIMEKILEKIVNAAKQPKKDKK